MKKSFMSLILLLSVAYGFSQAPQKMSYQCVVRKSGGELVANRNIGLRISILQGSASGNVVYQETYNPNPQTNANGLVSVEIGGGVALSGTFSDIDWGSGIYFLKTETDPAGGTSYTVSGTSQLLSVPYALHAKTAENGFSGNYEDLSNKPVLFSGYYSDLLNLPVFDGTWTNLAGKPVFAAVATSGSYNDLLNKPVLFDGSWTHLSGKPSLADVATSGDYTDLINRPAIFDGTWTNLTGKPSLADVATSGDYNDLINRPGSARETTDEFLALASQTTFNLSHTPSAASIVKMYINGVRISNSACSKSGSTLTYIPGNNGSYSLMSGDRIQFDYSY